MAPPAASETDLAAAVTRPLRALAIADAADLVAHIGRDPAPYPGRHLLAPARHRTWRRILLGTEVEDYLLGLGDAAGICDLVPDEIETPTLITQEDTANRLGVSVHTVIAWANASRGGGKLEVLYFPGRFRRFFAAQVDAIAVDRDRDPSYAARWAQVRGDFSLENRVRITDDHLPDGGAELPIPAEPEHFRAVRAAMIADEQGWTTYRRPDETVAGDLVLRFEPMPGYTRVRPTSRVLPYVLGLADGHGPDAARLIAYRKGLV